MSLVLVGLDGVRVAISSAITGAATVIPLATVIAPYITPPDPSVDYYYLTLVDYTNRPSAWERVKVTGKSGTNLTVVRNIASSTGAAIAFASGSIIQWTVGSDDLIDIAAAGGGGGGGGFFVLTTGASNTAFKFDNTSASPEYLSLTYMEFFSPSTSETHIRWYNNTGRILTISNLLVYIGYIASTRTGNFTLEVMINGSPSGVSIAIPNTATGFYKLYQDTVNSASVPAGAYMTYRISNSSASESGSVTIPRISLLLEEA